MLEFYDIPYSSVEKALNCALKYFDVPEKKVTAEIAVLSDEEVRELNRTRRGNDSVTDVLSFPALEKVTLPFSTEDYPSDVDPETGAVILGEVYIARDRALEQAAEYNHSAAREYAFLALHGFLHLMGYDHVSESDRERMERVQNEILLKAGITRDYVEKEPVTHTGFAAILGRPNAGKSTLINALVGEKVAIVSWKPQTTRNKILGILNRKDLQIIFVDTPGIHKPRNKLGDYMMRAVRSATEGVDAVIYVVDGEKGMDENDLSRIAALSEGKTPAIVAVNKIDHITKEKVAGILAALNEFKGLKAVVPISALRGKNVDVLERETATLMPEGIKLYPEDEYTDRNMRFMAAEIIREKALRLLDQEIPYGVAVSVNKYEYRPSGVLEIDADVICQKAAHKPIILGKNGAMIKKISEYAREDLEKMTGDRILLTLWVRVKTDWRDDEVLLNNLGYDKNKDL